MTNNKYNIREQHVAERMKVKDNLSNKAFRAFCITNNIISHKYGFDGSERYSSFQKHIFIKYTPDKICISDSGELSTTELKGCKNEGVRIKCECIEAYIEHNNLVNLFMFIFNSETNKYAYLPFTELKTMTEYADMYLDKNSDMGWIHHIPCDWFNWTDVPIIHERQHADNYQD